LSRGQKNSSPFHIFLRLKENGKITIFDDSFQGRIIQSDKKTSGRGERKKESPHSSSRSFRFLITILSQPWLSTFESHVPERAVLRRGMNNDGLKSRARMQRAFSVRICAEYLRLPGYDRWDNPSMDPGHTAMQGLGHRY
jgi:hypothetical protein